MIQHRETRILPYSALQMYDLVVDVGRYPEFLPWCIASRVYKEQDNSFYADLVIGYKMFKERFTSYVTSKKNEMVNVNYLSGPMKHLSNEWMFQDMESGGCKIDFYVDFEFKNIVFQKLAGAFFDEAFRRMVDSFEKRAEALYD